MKITKWTIYNNTLPWSDLSDKQKGKLLLANHSGIRIEGVGFLSIAIPVKFECNIIVYFAVKPEPTMAELFKDDWFECLISGRGEQHEKMIAKGWVNK
jgi:hypothetical protein